MTAILMKKEFGITMLKQRKLISDVTCFFFFSLEYAEELCTIVLRGQRSKVDKVQAAKRRHKTITKNKQKNGDQANINKTKQGGGKPAS